MSREIECPKCHTLVRVDEVDIIAPYKTTETAECPVCGETILRKNSRGDFEPHVISIEKTIEPYKSEYSRK